jgi:phosphatidate phosphatase APP1
VALRTFCLAASVRPHICLKFSQVIKVTTHRFRATRKLCNEHTFRYGIVSDLDRVATTLAEDPRSASQELILHPVLRPR